MNSALVKCRTIRVDGVPYDSSEADVRRMFEWCGHIVEVKCTMRNDTCKWDGNAWTVQYQSDLQANGALCMNNHKVDTKNIRVRLDIPSSDQPCAATTSGPHLNSRPPLAPQTAKPPLRPLRTQSSTSLFAESTRRNSFPLVASTSTESKTSALPDHRSLDRSLPRYLSNPRSNQNAALNGNLRDWTHSASLDRDDRLQQPSHPSSISPSSPTRGNRRPSLPDSSERALKQLFPPSDPVPASYPKRDSAAEQNSGDDRNESQRWDASRSTHKYEVIEMDYQMDVEEEEEEEWEYEDEPNGRERRERAASVSEENPYYDEQRFPLRKCVPTGENVRKISSLEAGKAASEIFADCVNRKLRELKKMNAQLRFGGDQGVQRGVGSNGRNMGAARSVVDRSQALYGEAPPRDPKQDTPLPDFGNAPRHREQRAQLYHEFAMRNRRGANHLQQQQTANQLGVGGVGGTEHAIPYGNPGGFMGAPLTGDASTMR
ncbi:hypothetical protein HK097_001675, partial [Rhizophlyctis rosea]